MHPALQHLIDRHRELTQSAEDGHIGVDDANATLRQLQAVDGTGAIWQVDPPTGQLTRAELPGLPAEVTDATHFVTPGDAARIVPGFSRPPTAPAAFSASTTAFAAEPASSFAAPTPPLTPPTVPNPFEQFDAPEHSATAPGFAGTRHGSRSLADDEGWANTPRHAATASRLAELLRANKAMAVLLAIVVAVAVAYAYAGPSSRAGSAVPGAQGSDNVPTAPAVLPGGTSEPEVAGPDPAEDTYDTSLDDVTELPAARGPSAELVRAAVATLTAANLTQVADLLGESPTNPAVAHAAAFYAGLQPAGMRLRVTETTPATETTATSVWEVRHAKTTVLTIETTWSRDDSGAWGLVTAPLP